MNARRRRVLGLVAAVVAAAGCSSGRSADVSTSTMLSAPSPDTDDLPAATDPATISVATTMPSDATEPDATGPDTTGPDTTEPDVTAPTTTIESTTTAVATTTTTTTTVPTTTPYGMPVADGARASYAHEHHDYPASDMFVPGGCGSSIVAPVNGTVLEARRVDSWDRAVDNPATRGGKSVAILGDDGVRYYLAHFEAIENGIEPGVRVLIGQALGLMGMTGRAGACHLHFAISPPCDGKEWAVRRGVIWPWGYLDAWRRGDQLSPVAEIEQWVADHPDACALAEADPNAADA